MAQIDPAVSPRSIQLWDLTCWTAPLAKGARTDVRGWEALNNQGAMKRLPKLGKSLASQIGKMYVALMNVIARKNLETYWRRHPETEQPLRAWLMMVRTQGWTGMDAVVRTYSKASPVNSERCVFDICGGRYRLIVAFKFSAKVAFIKFIGTHAQYDRVDAATVSQF